MNTTFRYFIPTEILFGAGSLNKLATISLPGKKALIVIGGGSVRQFGSLARVESLLAEQGISVVIFDKIQPNPIVEHVMEAATLAKKEHCDFVIGLGGGSSMDSAKSIAIMTTNPGHYWDYVNGGSGKGLPLVNNPLPIVCITTTAGTGTEADPWTVITDSASKEKIGFGCDKTFPVLSIVDPELMISVPANLTAYQGFDAFFHAAEGYIANVATPLSDIYALKSISLLSKSLAIAVKEPHNIDARADIALANTLSGMVESTSSCTSEHSLEHALSAYHPNLPHGAGLIMISLAYFSYFASIVPQRFIEMSVAMGGEPKAEGFLNALAMLQKNCGVDILKMSDFGIKKELFDAYAHNARYSMGGLFELDPAPLSHEQVIEILEKSFC